MVPASAPKPSAVVPALPLVPPALALEPIAVLLAPVAVLSWPKAAATIALALAPCPAAVAPRALADKSKPTAVALVWLVAVAPACAFSPIAVVPALVVPEPNVPPAAALKPTAVELLPKA